MNKNKSISKDSESSIDPELELYILNKDNKRINKKFINNFEDIWLGFRMGVYAFFCLKKFYTANINLTFYESLGQSKKYRLLNKNWIKRRKNSFEYLKCITKNKNLLNKNLDYLITNFISKFC